MIPLNATQAAAWPAGSAPWGRRVTAGTTPGGEEEPGDADGDIHEEHAAPPGRRDERSPEDGSGTGRDTCDAAPNPKDTPPCSLVGVGGLEGLEQGERAVHGECRTDALRRALR